MRKDLIDHIVNFIPFHIFIRGHNKMLLFRESTDYEFMISVLREPFILSCNSLLAVCLMPNHYHFLIKTTNAEQFPSVMRIINQRFSLYMHKKYGFTGPLFETRYHRKVVDTPAYILTVFRYILRNPLEAGIVSTSKSLLNYPWISLSPKFNFIDNGIEREFFGDRDSMINFILHNKEYLRLRQKHYDTTSPDYDELLSEFLHII